MKGGGRGDNRFSPGEEASSAGHVMRAMHRCLGTTLNELVDRSHPFNRVVRDVLTSPNSDRMGAGNSGTDSVDPPAAGRFDFASDMTGTELSARPPTCTSPMFSPADLVVADDDDDAVKDDDNECHQAAATRRHSSTVSFARGRAAGRQVSSWGVVLLRRVPGPGRSATEVALVNRRHSIGFQEIVCNRYVLSDLPLIWLLVRDATPTERQVWLTWPFHQQRRYLYSLCGPGALKRVPDHATYELAKLKFEYLKSGFWWSLSEYGAMAHEQQPQQCQRRRQRPTMETTPMTTPIGSGPAVDRGVQGGGGADRPKERGSVGKRTGARAWVRRPGEEPGDGAQPTSDVFRNFASRRKLLSSRRSVQRGAYPSGHRVRQEDDAVFVTLAALVRAANELEATSGTRKECQPFGFPKGRRLRWEADGDCVACAQRELAEETNVAPDAYTIVLDQTTGRPVEICETVGGLDGTPYRYVYYVAVVPENAAAAVHPYTNSYNAKQFEIGHCGWVNVREAASIFRAQRHGRRADVLLKAVELGFAQDDNEGKHLPPAEVSVPAVRSSAE